MPLISVIIPTYNRKEMLRKTLDSLFKQHYPRNKYEVIIVDDGSADGTEEMVKSIINEARCELKYYRQKHKGPAAVRNVGIERARGRILAFTNDDCLVNPEWLKEISNSLSSSEAVGVYGSIYSDLPPSFFIHSIISDERAITANLALRKETVKKVGMFDANFRQPSCEEGDLIWRITDQDGKILRNPKMRVYHFPSYRSFLKWLQQTKFLQYHVLLDTKHPGKRHLRKFRYIIWGFIIKRVIYFTFWGFLPLPMPCLVKLLIGLVLLWCKDFWELTKIKKQLKDSKFRVRLNDQFMFIFLHWLMNIFETFYLVKGIIKFKLLQRMKV